MNSAVEVEIVNKDENKENVELTTKELKKNSHLFWMQQEYLYKYIKVPELLRQIYLFLFLHKDNVILPLKSKLMAKFKSYHFPSPHLCLYT